MLHRVEIASPVTARSTIIPTSSPAPTRRSLDKKDSTSSPHKRTDDAVVVNDKNAPPSLKSSTPSRKKKKPPVHADLQKMFHHSDNYHQLKNNFSVAANALTAMYTGAASSYAQGVHDACVQLKQFILVTSSPSFLTSADYQHHTPIHPSYSHHTNVVVPGDTGGPQPQTGASTIRTTPRGRTVPVEALLRFIEYQVDVSGGTGHVYVEHTFGRRRPRSCSPYRPEVVQEGDEERRSSSPPVVEGDITQGLHHWAGFRVDRGQSNDEESAPPLQRRRP